MRDVNKKWFETIVRYDKTMEDGEVKKVNEVYVVDAITFGEAEESIAEEMKPYISGDFDIKNINPAPYSEIFFSEEDTDDKYYRVKLNLITINETTQKEKKSKVTYLVQAGSLEQARKNTEEVMNETIIDYEFVSVTETKILYVFEKKDK
ncbi:MAG: DUF4494 domain-containing protein [Prevotella sp.]|nr:DUF4494 domain-containing protein [Bacteroidales bacterium]MDY4229522.1 DUF4494 domain-containing protein [Prevotella sp.]